METRTIREVSEALKKSRRVLILHHTHPDGDTVGSGAALKALLISMGKTVLCRCEDDPDENLGFLLYEQESLTGDIPGDYDLIVAVDVAAEQQLGRLSFLAGQCSLVIDHHGLGSLFAPTWLMPECAACGEMIDQLYRLWLREGAVQPNREAEIRIYAAILHDTGNFKYSNVTPETLRIAAFLNESLNRDDPDTTSQISRKLFDERTLEARLADGLAAEKTRKYDGGRLCVSVVTLDDMSQRGLREKDFSESVEIPRTVLGCEIGVIAREQPGQKGTYRVSSRSNGKADVALACQEFGGGGHQKAAGCTFSAPDEETAYRMIEECFGKALGRIL
ncbi:MAG: DHH family phosphoesterase [Clostridia bacterium]|nr:DHH family phosphoesterase [Clostridia bacterium]